MGVKSGSKAASQAEGHINKHSRNLHARESHDEDQEQVEGDQAAKKRDQDITMIGEERSHTTTH